MSRPVRLRWFLLLALVAGLVNPAPVSAVESQPNPDLLRDQLARELPALWKLESLTVSPPSATEGEGPNRVVTQPFAAAISLTAATYAVDTQRGPFTLLRPVAERGMRKTLSGVVKSSLRDGNWVSRFGFQNGYVMDAIGQPIERFPGRTVVVGTPEAAKLVSELDEVIKQQVKAEAEQRQREKERMDQQVAQARADAERAAAERTVIDQRAAQLADLRRLISEGERQGRVAALEAALAGSDTSIRELAMDAALSGRDPIVANLALRNFFAQKKSLPVQLFATKENKDSELVLTNLGPLTLSIERFEPISGALEGRMGAPGYSITLPGSATGTLAQTELLVNTFGCSLQLRLSEVKTMDGILRCQTLPVLIARITLD
jgi:hypothetical protein